MYKKPKNYLFLLSFAALVLSFVFTSCKKEEQAEDFQTGAQDLVQLESIQTEVDNLSRQASDPQTAEQAAAHPQADQFAFSSCATITRDSINQTITIDFGSGCTGRDGRTRSGKILIQYSGGGYFDPGSSRTTSFDNYYVDGRKIEGSRSCVNNGLNASGNMNWTITATGMKMTRPDGSWRSWNGQRNREMTAGFGDSTWVNDVYRINGTGSGTNSQGTSFTANLVNLVRDHSCHWITSGTIDFVPSNRPSRSIDFGNGTCDDQATVTVNGQTRTIQLRP